MKNVVEKFLLKTQDRKKSKKILYNFKLKFISVIIIHFQVKFEIPYFTVSGIQVRYLKIIEKSGYQALPWVRYITQNGDYQLRTNSWFLSVNGEFCNIFWFLKISKSRDRIRIFIMLKLSQFNWSLYVLERAKMSQFRIFEHFWMFQLDTLFGFRIFTENRKNSKKYLIFAISKLPRYFSLQLSDFSSNSILHIIILWTVSELVQLENIFEI